MSRPQGGSWAWLYLVKAPQRDAAHHDGGVQAQAGEEAGALQGHVCQRPAKECSLAIMTSGAMWRDPQGPTPQPTSHQSPARPKESPNASRRAPLPHLSNVGDKGGAPSSTYGPGGFCLHGASVQTPRSCISASRTRPTRWGPSGDGEETPRP